MPHKRNPILSNAFAEWRGRSARTPPSGLRMSHSGTNAIFRTARSNAGRCRIRARLIIFWRNDLKSLDTLIVYPENMLKNLNLTRGLVGSGQLLLALTQKGVSREDSYAWTQRNAMKAWDEGGEYREVIRKTRTSLQSFRPKRSPAPLM
ncbi:MAG: hypothetical protein IPK58_05030 [Acidobacteria bacterium]|nr:hypothetical protein [Acidobacteriota bacterium]